MPNQDLPHGLAWSKTPEGAQIQRKDIVEQLDSFSDRVASEIENVIFNEGEARVVIPISGGIIAYFHLIDSLKRKGVNLGKIDFVFAYHPHDSLNYFLSKDCSSVRTTFVVDDIYDSGKSFESIVIALGMKKDDVLPRYLSTKIDLPNKLPGNINQDLYVLINKWLTTGFGMDGSLDGMNKDGVILNPYLNHMSNIISMLERVVAIPIEVEDPKSSAINDWKPEDVESYIKALTNPAISLANGNRQFEIDLLIIFSTISALKHDGTEALFNYLNQLHLHNLEVEA